MHILAVIMLHQHKFVFIKEKESYNYRLLVKTLYFLRFIVFFFYFVFFSENVEKGLQSWVFREGQ